MKISDRKKFYIEYTGLFLILCAAVFGYFFFTGRTLIWKNDGWMQSYRALMHYSVALRNSIRGLITGKGWHFEQFFMAIGEGDDVITSLSYYCVGDPFSALAVLVPASKMYLYYCLAMLLKLFVGGVFFSWLCRETEIKNDKAILAGSLIYSFCYWGMLNAARHPFFLTPLTFFPLVIAGIERVIRKKSFRLLAIGVGFCGLSNFYLFVSVVIITVIYVAVRLLFGYLKNPKEMFSNLGRIFTGSVIGSLIAAVILVPNYMVVLSSSRVGGDNTNALLYPYNYYGALLGRLIAGHEAHLDGFWTCLGFTGVWLLAIAFLLSVKGDKKAFMIKIYWAVSILLLLFPIAGRMMNGMTYVTNRWCFLLAVLAAYTVTYASELFLTAEKNAISSEDNLSSTTDYRIMVVFLILYTLLVSLLPQSRGIDTLLQLLIAMLLMFLLKISGSRLSAKWCIIGGCVLAIALQGFFQNSSYGADYASEAKTFEEARGYLNANDAGAVREYAIANNDADFFRIGSERATLNSGFSSDISTIQHYWSVGNASVPQFREKLSLTEGNSYNYKTDDKKAIIMALAGAKYYTIPTGWSEKAPYGYEKRDEVFVKGAQVDNSRYDVYESDYALPIGYTYKNIITADEWDRLDAAKKQEALLYAAVIGDEDLKNTADTDITNSGLTAEELSQKLVSRELSYEAILPEDGSITRAGNTFEVATSGAQMQLLISGLDNSETYLYTKGFSYMPYDGDTMYQNRKSSVYLSLELPEGGKGIITYRFKDDAHYDGRDTYMENAGYSEKAPEYMKVKFSRAGRYSFDEFSVFAQPMDILGAAAGQLKEDSLICEPVADTSGYVRVLGVVNDTLTGTVNCSRDEVLCINIPYSTGFKAYVDGSRAELIKVNYKNAGLFLKKGEHEIKLTYETPYLNVGKLLTLLGIMILIGYEAYTRFYKRKRP